MEAVFSSPKRAGRKRRRNNTGKGGSVKGGDENTGAGADDATEGGNGDENNEKNEDEDQEEQVSQTLRISRWQGRTRSRSSSSDGEVGFKKPATQTVGAEKRRYEQTGDGNENRSRNTQGEGNNNRDVDRDTPLTSTRLEETEGYQLSVFFSKEACGTPIPSEVHDEFVKDDEGNTTDMEDGDEAEFTILRRRRKEERQEDRNHDGDAMPDLHTLDGNKEFVAVFDSYMNRSASEKAKETFTKATKCLFVGPTSWLSHMTSEYGQDFRLRCLTDWENEKPVLVNDPSAWVEQLPEDPGYGTRR